MVKGLTTAQSGKPDYPTALQQHARYVLALEECGLEVMVLEADEDYPDSTFVEDTALLTSRCAVLTRPGAPSRRGETAAIRPVIEQFYPQIEEIVPPGTVEAGDIMMVGNHFYIGLSERTNRRGAEQMMDILNRHGMTGSTVELKHILHLKSGVSYLENNTLLASGELRSVADFKDYHIIEVPDREDYAANCVWINGTILVPAGYPVTLRRIQQAGYPTIALEVSEFRKLDGGLSCLSLRF